MKRKAYSRVIEIAAFVLLSVSVAVAEGGPEEKPPADPPPERFGGDEYVERFMNAPIDTQDFYGFGIIIDVPDAAEVRNRAFEGKEQPLQVELDLLKDEKTEDQVSSIILRPDGKPAERSPWYLLFNLDIYYGEPGETNDNLKYPFNALTDENAITVYIINQWIGDSVSWKPKIYIWKKREGMNPWVSLDSAADFSDSEDMKTSSLMGPNKAGVSSFRIYRWPSNDRIIGIDEH